jgi:predicted regulator of Ras-like GTPase activity (Roadblock/LC7/MglB family)
MAAAQEPARIPMPAAKPAAAPFVVPLAVLAGSWPEPIRNEILHSGLTEAQVSLPFEAVEQGLRQGRILLPWKMIRMWVRPAPQLRVSPEDATVLELPLAAVAPLFLTRRGEMNAGRNKVAVDQDIPNLFFGFPQPEPENKSPTQDTNFYVWEDAVDQVKSEQSAGSSSPGTRFVAKYATPNEVVSRAAALEGVAGALIALPDGLMVANRLPSDLNGDTLSAFLPQIFSKVSQCTRELRMGELNNLNFTVGNVPWKIFRVNAIFFAAFGRAGAPLPTAQLAALAAELDHKPK